ncbi:uncharacterized protein LOC126783661 [Argentina anserina]|uniref:uncharacterized protein LOC126783661 n=1 Tax=Argentina anserina TaxID=57926 RepID=UPI0021764F23|nr:uncharacterized protein LOC126783661 [Potentilla anserina]XP_050365122.1 uncharacterized protein LOC126783661 [Potentilla anserina]
MVFKLINTANRAMGKPNGALKLNVMLYHGSEESHVETLPAEWYRNAFPKLSKLTRLLKDVDFVDGRLFNVADSSVIVNARVEHKMVAFKSLARVFIGSPLVQQKLWNNVVGWSGGRGCNPFVCFSKPSERQPLVVKSMSVVGSIMNITAQQRQKVRVKIAPQVTQHGIWTGALEEILNGLKCELDCMDGQCSSRGMRIGQQIVCSCLKFLADASVSYGDDSASWMRLSTAKITDSSSLPKWEDLLEMFNDVIDCLKYDGELLHYLTKVEVMKEGLSQIKDVLVDKSIGFKEVRHQESLVHKKLSKTLGHSSKCLFTLLLYYLYGHVRDIEVDLSGGLYSISDKSLCLCMGRIVTSDEETMIWSGVKQLDRALGLFKFVWETAGMEGGLQLQGHIWCVGAENRILTYRGNTFFVHGIRV